MGGRKSGKAGKKKQGHIQTRSERDMYVLAGLPLGMYPRAAAFLQERLPLALVIGNPAPSTDGPLYSPKSVAAIVRAVGAFAVARRQRGLVQPPAPATITLLYVPAADEQRLVDAFDFAVMPIPLPGLVAWTDRHRQARHDFDAVMEALIAATTPASAAREGLNHVRRRLAYQSSDEGLLLPPRNFLLGDGDLRPVFRLFRDGERSWSDRMTELGPALFTSDDLPKRIPANKTAKIFVDDRGMAFPIAHPTAYDGPAREIGSDDDAGAVVSTLRSLYRFGSALPRGLHHDAQRSDGSPLGGATFHCEEKGVMHAQGDYANVYPNDFVRLPPKR